MKYIVTRTDETPLPTDEPCFVIRAQDKLALNMVSYYWQLSSAAGQPDEFLRQVDDHYAAVAEWQRTHQDKIKAAD